MVGVPFIQHGIAILALEIKMCAAKMDPFTSLIDVPVVIEDLQMCGV